MNEEVNTEETGKIAHMEAAIGLQGGRLDSFSGRLDKVEEMTGETNRGVQTLLSRQGGFEATRGMVPVGAIFAVIALILTMAGLGFTALRNAEEKAQARVDNVVDLEDSRHETVSAIFVKFADKLQADDERETRDEEKHLSTLKDVTTLRADVDENQTELDVFWEWYHTFLPEWGRINEAVGRNSEEMGSLDQGSEVQEILRRLEKIESIQSGRP